MFEELQPFQLVAGHPVLDFANTFDNRYLPERVVDLIPTYSDFLRFCLQAGVINGRQAFALAGLERETALILHRAVKLREAVYQIFVALDEKRTIPAGELLTLNSILQEAARHKVLTSERVGEIRWNWAELEEDPAGPLWVLAEAAADLLISPEAKRVSQCSSQTCRWLFLDTSKNHSRRWCDMKLCGNRVKARNHYQRGRTERTDASGSTIRD